MWETQELGGEDLLWSSTAFSGGIGGQQQATCGAVSSSAVCLGLRHRCSLDDKEKADQGRDLARLEAFELVSSFREEFGNITCIDLLGFDFSQPDAYQRFRDSGIWREKCDNYIQFVIEKLYQLDEE